MYLKMQLPNSFCALLFAAALTSVAATSAIAKSPLTSQIVLSGTSLFASSNTVEKPGKSLHLAQLERRKPRKRRRTRRSRRRSGATKQPASGPAKDIPGRYAVLRAESKDAGCLLSLRGNGRAQVGPGCQDHGFQIFDPVRWRFSRGTLVLQARAGHRVSFSRKDDGTWQRSPTAKKALGLKKY